MKVERLVAMANDIAAFFASEPEREVAVAGVANHLTRFWEPRMRRELVAYVHGGGEELHDIAAEAVRRLSSA